MKERDADGLTFLMHAANPYNRYAATTASSALTYEPTAPPTTTASSGAKRNTRTRAIPFPVKRLGRVVSEDASPAPASLGAGGSEEILRRHSLQKHVFAGESGDRGSPVGGGPDASNNDSGAESKGEPLELPQHFHPTSTTADAEQDSSSSWAVGSASAKRRKSAKRAGSAHGQDAENVRPQEQPQMEKPQMMELLNREMDPRVPVLKTAVALNQECLWKEQVSWSDGSDGSKGGWLYEPFHGETIAVEMAKGLGRMSACLLGSTGRMDVSQRRLRPACIGVLLPPSS